MRNLYTNTYEAHVIRIARGAARGRIRTRTGHDYASHGFTHDYARIGTTRGSTQSRVAVTLLAHGQAYESHGTGTRTQALAHGTRQTGNGREHDNPTRHAATRHESTRTDTRHEGARDRQQGTHTIHM